MDRLKRLRTEKGLSQARLAARAELDPSTVNQIERGARGASLETLRKLADALGVSLYELMEEEAPKAPAPSASGRVVDSEEKPVDYREMYFQLGRQRLALVEEALKNAEESLGTEEYAEFIKLPVAEQHSRLKWAERWREIAEGILASIEDEAADLAGEQRDELAKRRETLATTIERFKAA